jgi:hypothetical protein
VVGVVAVVAVTVGAVLAPRPAEAAKKPDKDTATFVITTDEALWMLGSDGTFKSRGAIKDLGSVVTGLWSEGIADLELTGANGSVYIDLSGDSFEVIDATGAHTSAIGATGSYTETFEPAEGKVPPELYGYLKRTLKGNTVPCLQASARPLARGKLQERANRRRDQ